MKVMVPTVFLRCSFAYNPACHALGVLALGDKHGIQQHYTWHYIPSVCAWVAKDR